MSFLDEQQQKANENLQRVTVETRLEDRLLWDKLLTVVLGILGFSLTLFSTDFLSSQITSSCSRYYLVISWVLYSLALFTGFLLLKKETEFQRKEALRNTLYAMDTAEFLDSHTLQVKDGKKEQFIALQVLRGKSTSKNDFWSKNALEMFEKHKRELNSYKLSGNPDELFSIEDRKVIMWSERLFYILIFIATSFLIVSVTSILF